MANIYYLLVVCKMSDRKVIYDSKVHKFKIELPVNRIEIKYYNYGVDIIENVEHTISIICDKWNYRDNKKIVCVPIYYKEIDISQIIGCGVCGDFCIDVNEENICKIVDCYLSRQKYLKRGIF